MQIRLAHGLASPGTLCWIFLLLENDSRIYGQVCDSNGTSDTVGTCLAPDQVTLIISVFKRQYLLRQLFQAAQQSFRPSVIFVYQNGAPFLVNSFLFCCFDAVFVYQKDMLMRRKQLMSFRIPANQMRSP